MSHTGIDVAGLVFQMVLSPRDDLLDQVVAVLAGSASGMSPAVCPSGSPYERAYHAAGILTAAFESHLGEGGRASRFFGPPPPVDSDYKDAEREPDAHETARFYASMSALALSRVHRTLDDREGQSTWRERSRSPFLASYRVIPPLAESRLAIASVIIRRVPTRQDLADYRRRCDELLGAFYAAFAELGR
jgi:hypothetical protein